MERLAMNLVVSDICRDQARATLFPCCALRRRVTRLGGGTCNERPTVVQLISGRLGVTDGRTDSQAIRHSAGGLEGNLIAHYTALRRPPSLVQSRGSAFLMWRGTVRHAGE